MPPHDLRSLRDCIDTAESRSRHLRGRHADVSLGALARGTCLDADLSMLAGKSVLIATRDQLSAAVALIDLDGLARRLTLMPPDVAREHWTTVIAEAEIDAIVTDGDDDWVPASVARVISRPTVRTVDQPRPDSRPTEWVLFTSGTTGTPKMVVHSLAGLTAAIKRRETRDDTIVWGTFYDMRRYGGLQIFFRAMLDGGSLILSDAKEPVGDFLERLGRHGITHISGTPSHWRRALMSPSARAIAPKYVRLSGEIADQAILDNLIAFFAPAPVGHAYASTEAGVGFEVNDGREGFLANVIGQPGDVEMKVVDGTLRIRSRRIASRYLGRAGAPVAGPDGFVDTGDMLELRGDRYHFAGRKGGIINVGGLKVHPEEVEAVINRHPQVRMSLVHPRKSPITGAIVVADVVLAEAGASGDGIRGEIMHLCRERLPQHKVPAMIRFVPALAVAESGKLVRRQG